MQLPCCPAAVKAGMPLFFSIPSNSTENRVGAFFVKKTILGENNDRKVH